MACGLVVPENATHAPESRLYWYEVIAVPPFEEGAVKETESAPSVPVIPVMVGAPGTE